MLNLCFDIQGSDLVVEGQIRAAGPAPELHAVAKELIEMLADSYELSLRDGERMFRLVKRAGAGE